MMNMKKLRLTLLCALSFLVNAFAEQGAVATAWIDKTITDFADGTNATLQILVKTTPEVESRKPNVLFIGTACSSHGLTSEVIRKSLNAASKNAKTVDYYIYTARYNSAVASGTLSNGQQLAQQSFSLSMSGGQHGALSKFYDKLYDIFSNSSTAEKYDYVIFEFDGSRLGSGYSQNTYEAFVADKMLKYYQEQRVIWIVDACHDANSEIWPNNYWRPNTYYYSAGNKRLTDAEYRGIVGLFDPNDYAQNGTAYSMSKTSVYAWRSGLGNTRFYANDRYSVQANYTDPNAVVALIANQIKPVAYSVDVADCVRFELGLSVGEVSGFWTTNTVSLNNLTTNVYSSTYAKWTNSTSDVKWTPFSSTELVSTPSNIAVNIEHINSVIAMKFLVSISDLTGKFLNSGDGAELTDDGEAYEKDPNLGPARVSLVTENGSHVKSDSIAYTRMKWKFLTYKITTEVVEGEGHFVIAGHQTNELDIARCTSPVVEAVPNDGYEVYRITVDGKDISVTQLETVFEDIQDDHEVKIWCTPIVASCWIVDHYDAGPNNVFLAFMPEFSAKIDLAKWIDSENSRFAVEFEDGSIRDVVLRGNGKQDVIKGWVWVEYGIGTTFEKDKTELRKVKVVIQEKTK